MILNLEICATTHRRYLISMYSSSTILIIQLIKLAFRLKLAIFSLKANLILKLNLNQYLKGIRNEY